MLARKKKPEVVYNWHPNFRVVEALPDIKQVRTGFLVNFVTIVLALAAFGWLMYTEVSLYQLNAQIDNVQHSIDDKDKSNKSGLLMSKKFVAQSKNLQVLAKFYATKVPPLEVLDALAAARPETMLFDSVAIEPVFVDVGTAKNVPAQRVVISGTITGATDEALAVESYAAKVLADPVFKDRVADPAKDCKRDAHREGPNMWKFTITINLKPIA